MHKVSRSLSFSNLPISMNYFLFPLIKIKVCLVHKFNPERVFKEDKSTKLALVTVHHALKHIQTRIHKDSRTRLQNFLMPKQNINKIWGNEKL